MWLVDQAVLALGKEQRLDPLPDFVVPEPSLLDFQDTRSLVYGLLPFAEIPGGDGGVESSLFNRQTVRRNFVPVPYYEPDLRVGADGKLTVNGGAAGQPHQFRDPRQGGQPAGAFRGGQGPSRGAACR